MTNLQQGIVPHKAMHLSPDTLTKIKILCIENNVKSLYAFGSVLRNDFNESSDVDLIIDFNTRDPFKYAEKYYSFKSSIEALLNRNIDLLEQRAIKNKYFLEELEKTKTLLYGL